MFSRLKKLQDSQAAVVLEMRSMLDLAEKESRQLGEGENNGKEKETYASLEKRSTEIQDGIQLEQRLQDRERALPTMPALSAPTDEEARAAKEDNSETQIERRNREFTVPATARRYQRLKAFTGPDADKNAYLSGMWFRATLLGDRRAARFCIEHGVPMGANSWSDVDRGESRTAHNETTNSQGGYLVPDILERTIIDLRETYGVFRRESRVVPMGSDLVNIPRRLTGLTASFFAENIEITESNKTWGIVQLTAKKLGVLTKWSTELDEDAVISVGDDLASEIAYAFAVKEDQCGFIGDASATYGGMTGVTVEIDDGTHTAGVVAAAATHTAFSTLTMADFHGVTGKLPIYATPNAKWYVSKAGYAASMERLMYAGGGNTVLTLAGGAGPSFMGYPVVFSQVLNAVLTADISKIKILFGDLRMATTMGTRRGVMIKTSAERYLEFDQLAIVGTERFWIEGHDFGDTTNPGPIVALKTPAA